MKNGVTGYFDVTGTNGMTVRVHYAETYDDKTAIRNVEITKLQVHSENYQTVYYLHGSVSIDGVVAFTMDKAAGGHSVYTSRGTYTDVTGTLGSVSDIVSNVDGSKSITINVDVSGYTGSGSGSGNGWTANGAQIIELTSINTGCVYLDNGSGFDAYQVYIDNGSGLDLHIPYIDNGSGWDLCS